MHRQLAALSSGQTEGYPVKLPYHTIMPQACPRIKSRCDVPIAFDTGTTVQLPSAAVARQTGAIAARPRLFLFFARVQAKKQFEKSSRDPFLAFKSARDPDQTPHPRPRQSREHHPPPLNLPA